MKENLFNKKKLGNCFLRKNNFNSFFLIKLSLYKLQIYQEDHLTLVLNRTNQKS